MQRIMLILLVISSLITACAQEQNTINLRGEWVVQLDSLQKGFEVEKSKPINLPGSLAESGYGEKTVGSDFGILTPEYRYIGVAWYRKEIEIPRDWDNKALVVFLERVLWESRVFVDGKELSVQDALGTPHIHKIGNLTPGRHELVVKVDNTMIHNIGDKGHGYGDYTQGIWNGIVGRMELQAHDPTYISQLRTFSQVDKDQLKVELEITAEEDENATVTVEITDLHGETNIIETSVQKKLAKGKNGIEVPVALENKLKKWSEFDPEVYQLKVKVETKKYTHTKDTEFGFVNFSHDGTKVLVNGQPVFLRGNLDCVHFPLTGYPSANVEDWEKIFKTHKDYGLNHVRYHSWCPPEAAFKAANRVGIYLQAEASVWIDWWMSTDMVARGRPEMDTQGHPKGLGHDPDRDKFVIDEMNRVVDHYGNHPSFAMFCIGNELGNANFDVIESWVSDLKKKDPRRLYAVSTARKITETDDYSATHYIQGVGRTRGLNGPRTNWDFEDTYSQMNIPIIAHEIGQWPVYPSWTEIDKYTGTLKARNFEEFKAIATKNGIDDQHEDFKLASGALNQIMYKYEIESFLRTKSCAGVQLLSMQDYQGQGEALIGWLDAHWESKGITTPEKFRQHFDETVPLLRMAKFVWTNNEVFEARAQLSHHGQNNIADAQISGTITTESGKVLLEEKWNINRIAVGDLVDLGQLSMPLEDIKEAQKLTIRLVLEGTSFQNKWDIWVFPGKPGKLEIPEDMVVTDQWNANTKNALNEGKKVLLIASKLGNEENSVKLNFYPLYWSLTFFPGQGKTSIGMLLKDEHPAFDRFPTSFHSDWQWEPLMPKSKAFLLNNMPRKYKPIAQVVDDFHRNNKVGAIFELKVGEGKLLVCGFDVMDKTSPISTQLQQSLVSYLQSPDFAPDQRVDLEGLDKMFATIESTGPSVKSDGFDGSILNVKAGNKLKTMKKAVKWDKSADQVLSQAKGTDYKVTCKEVLKTEAGTAWVGEQIQLKLKCPDGILGELQVHFKDLKQQGVSGIVEFEGRKVKLDKHTGDGKWIKLHVMREDSNDGELVLNAYGDSDQELMITQIVLVKR